MSTTTPQQHLARLIRPSCRQSQIQLNGLRRSNKTHIRPITTTTPLQIKAKVREPPNRNTFAKIRFTTADIPPYSFWERRLVTPFVPNNEVTPAECYDACEHYVTIASQNQSGWRQRTLSLPLSTAPQQEEGSKIPLYTLQYAGNLLLTQRARTLAIGTHILHSGTVLGYPPSVLALGMLGFKTKLLDDPRFADARDALDRLVSAISPSPQRPKPKGGPAAQPVNPFYHPDIFTLAALRHASRHDDARALELLKLAAKSFRTLPPSSSSSPTSLPPPFPSPPKDPEPQIKSWQWRTRAIMQEHAILVRRGSHALAAELLRRSIHDDRVDAAEIGHQYALTLSPDDNPERAALLEGAVVGGVEAAAVELARVARRKVVEGVVEEGWSEEQMRVIADEWAGIAGDEAAV